MESCEDQSGVAIQDTGYRGGERGGESTSYREFHGRVATVLASGLDFLGF
ncbi:hypothetical protein HPP92_018236 [Vanilla planifolia]|uniref:Uncharacterized protein n=1 Tax=Vanilla planifolia TaxID=51239 RepID=A0A835Q5D0_VANPL|nr:hypothetical protein HPP92_018236 [Vanilla planifolia]